MEAFLLSTGVIFLAELDDKSQLIALTSPTKFKARTVLIGITLATAVVHLASVVLGKVVGPPCPPVSSPCWLASRSSGSPPGRCAATR